MRKTHITAVIEPETLRRVEADRSQRRDEDGKPMSRSAVVQEALELWLELVGEADRERATRVSEQIEETQKLIVREMDRTRRMVYNAQLAGEMSYQLYVSISNSAGKIDRQKIRARAAKLLDSDRRTDIEDEKQEREYRNPPKLPPGGKRGNFS